jgi:hypothetical protein
LSKVNILLLKEIKVEIEKNIRLKTCREYQPTEEEIIIDILTLYTSRYKNMIKGTIKAVNNARLK